MDYQVKYKVSLYPSKYSAYQSKKRKTGEVKLFVSNIWNFCKNFYEFKTISF